MFACFEAVAEAAGKALQSYGKFSKRQNVNKIFNIFSLFLSSRSAFAKASFSKASAKVEIFPLSTKLFDGKFYGISPGNGYRPLMQPIKTMLNFIAICCEMFNGAIRSLAARQHPETNCV